MREDLIMHLKRNGIETAVHYPSILPNLPCYKNIGTKLADFPVANALQNKVLSLPLYPELTETQVGFVAEKIKLFYN
jgi:dTDP-4-amino-4,6-dideoxygalactose transaminase